MINTFWKWLLHSNAKALFLVALLAFLGIAAWRIWIEARALRAAASPTLPTEHAEPPPTLPEYRELGLAGLISNHLARAHDSIPVNPFRPSFDDMISALRPAPGTTETTPGATGEAASAAAPPDAAPTAGAPGATDVDAQAAPTVGAARPDSPFNAEGRPRRPRPGEGPPRITYRGMFRRSDDTMAAWIEDHAEQRIRFFDIGADVHGATVLKADMTELTLRLPAGQEERLAFGQSFEIPPTENE